MTDITAGDLDFEVPTKAPFVPTVKKRLRKGLLALLAGAVIAAGAGYGAYEYVFASRFVTTDDAYVGANVAEINSQVSGPVLQVAVDDTRPVKKGDVLVVI